MFVSQCLKLKFVDLSHSSQQCPPRRLTKCFGVVVLQYPLPECLTPALKGATRHFDGAVDEVTGQAKEDSQLIPLRGKSFGLHDNDVPVIFFYNPMRIYTH